MSIATERQAHVSVTVGGSDITFETGKLAKQADGAVVVRSGETMVLATAQGRMEAREGADFFPLTVDVEERMYAAGKIPGGFFKREGRPTEKAILTARMIDRPIRPLWPKGFRNEVHIVATTLSPDLVVVGTKDALTMVEAGAHEIPEELLLQALDRAHQEIRRICDVQEELQRRVGKAKWIDSELTLELERDHADRIRQRIQAEGLREGAAAVEETVEEIFPPVSMDSTEEEIIRRMQIRSSFAMILERTRLAAVEQPVREQFENDLRALTEAEQDPKELKSAKRHLLFGRIEEQVQLPFPGAPVATEASDEP